MSGFTISEIREALADQIRNNLTRDTKVYAYPIGEVPGPAVHIFPSGNGEYVDYWQTFGPEGLALVAFDVIVDPGGQDSMADAARRLDDYLSCGTGNGSSVIDAIGAADTTGRRWSLGLTGVTVEFGTVSFDAASFTARISLRVTVAKSGAAA